MTAANAAPIGQNASVPEPLPLPGLDAMEHDVFVLTVAVVVHSPPSQLVDDVAITVALIGVVSIELSAVTHWLTLLVLT
jgi:hypothetical protein